MKIVVLGATGMLGYAMFYACLKRKIDAYAVVRNKQLLIERLGHQLADKIYAIDDAKNIAAIEAVLSDIQPDFVINCIGIVKQSPAAERHAELIAVNSLLPHQLQLLGLKHGFKLLHISTDCVFDGKKGLYTEDDIPNAYDPYGKSKYLGEVNYGCGLTLRTSIIGHEITEGTHGLLEWFLAQEGKARGFTRAIFSGPTTTELTALILDVVIPANLPADLYHVSVDPISKYELLKIIAEVYKKNILIEPSEDIIIDRSLNSSRFQKLTGYAPPSWHTLIKAMHAEAEPLKLTIK